MNSFMSFFAALFLPLLLEGTTAPCVTRDLDENCIISNIPETCARVNVYTSLSYRHGDYLVYPYVVRFEDNKGKPLSIRINLKDRRKVRKTPIEKLQFEGFLLKEIGNDQTDYVAQQAMKYMKDNRLTDYGNRTNPVYYFERANLK